MDVKKAYNLWAPQYDSNENKTRDLEAVSLRETLKDLNPVRCLEVGCGTGKNTVFLMQKANSVIAVDLSEEMLSQAKAKVQSDNVRFVHANITEDWHFAAGIYDLVTFSLVLEHIEDLNDIFKKVNAVTTAGSLVYVGELHPFKQYTGSKARFDTDRGQQIVTCFNHHISDFVQAAKKNGFEIAELREFFDNNDKTAVPRILALLFVKR